MKGKCTAVQVRERDLQRCMECTQDAYMDRQGGGDRIPPSPKGESGTSLTKLPPQKVVE